MSSSNPDVKGVIECLTNMLSHFSRRQIAEGIKQGYHPVDIQEMPCPVEQIAMALMQNKLNISFIEMAQKLSDDLQYFKGDLEQIKVKEENNPKGYGPVKVISGPRLKYRTITNTKDDYKYYMCNY